jgi:hypothetical protein
MGTSRRPVDDELQTAPNATTERARRVYGKSRTLTMGEAAHIGRYERPPPAESPVQNAAARERQNLAGRAARFRE